jgi:hypothetical protein
MNIDLLSDRLETALEALHLAQATLTVFRDTALAESDGEASTAEIDLAIAHLDSAVNEIDESIDDLLEP